MIEPIFEVIPHYPGVYIAILEDKNFCEAPILYEFSQEINACLHVKSLTPEKYDASLEAELFEFTQKRYNNHATQYDFVFVCANDVNNILEVANKIYRIVKNAGHLFFLCKKELSVEYSEVFENSNFVALNTIPLDDTYDIVAAKKMHGWRKV